MEQQSFKNHTRWDPVFHFVLMPILLLNVIFTVIWVVRHYATHTHTGPWLIVVSIALFLTAGKARAYSLKVQDRVIRLEEKMRLLQFCSPEELIELDSLTLDQYVGLRFASNAELPQLARRAVREKLSRKQIKESVANWRADSDRV